MPHSMKGGQEYMCRVSVITVCYNSEKTIEKTILSVLQQTHPVDEYWIIDGASSDGTIDIVRKYEDAFGGRMHVVSEQDHGIYDAMNKGIRMASGDLIGILNSDDYYELDTVEQILNAYQNESYAVLYGKMRLIAESGAISEVFPSHVNLKQEMINHPTCFVTKKTYEQYGMFDLQYVSVADYDLMLRYAEISEIKFIPIPVVLANFSLGGTCSTQKAYFDLLKMQVNRGGMSKREAWTLRWKAKISSKLRMKH